MLQHSCSRCTFDARSSRNLTSVALLQNQRVFSTPNCQHCGTFGFDSTNTYMCYNYYIMKHTQSGNEDIKNVLSGHMNDLKVDMLANVQSLSVQLEDMTAELKAEISESTSECFERFEDSFAGIEERLGEVISTLSHSNMIGMYFMTQH